ncbi:MAG: xylulose kinase [Herpetosiphonaceae bacterium]|nr:xylulose kinase [Herpetosiphonaceae bacterium]
MALQPDLVIGVDCSTTASKAVVWDRHGRLVAEGRATFPLLNPHPGWYEQHAEDWWTATTAALHAAISQLDPRRLGALCVTHQRETFVPVDAHGHPLRDAMLWIDERSPLQMAALDTRFGRQRVHQITGKPVALTPSLPKILWLQEHEPDVLQRAYKLLDVHAYLVRRFTGSWRTSWASADPMGLVDMRSFSWSTELMTALGLDPAQYVELVPPGTVLGEVTEEAARITGLPAGLPVVAGAGDGQAAGLGANITRSGQAYLNLGTAIASGTHAEHYTADPAFRTMASPQAGAYTLETLLRGGTFTVSWFVERFAADLRTVDPGRSVEEQLDALAAQVPPGALGLMLVPYWSSVTNPYWDSAATGITVGWTGAHRREHFYRAILEGIAFEQRLATEGVEAATLQPVQEYIAMGGGSRSTLWCQMLADVTGKRVTRASSAEATCLGAGILAAAAVGWYPDVRAAAAAMTGTGATFEPRQAVQQVYDRLYNDVYRGLYPALRDSLARLTELTHSDGTV